MDELEAALIDRAFLDDPYSVYARLREEAPVYWSPSWNGWLVSRYDAVKQVLTDTATFSSAGRVRPRMRSITPEAWDRMRAVYGDFQGFFWSDPPEYTEHRAAQNASFKPRVRGMDQVVLEIAERLLDDAAEADSVDVTEDFANPLPLLVIFDLLGAPQADRRKFRDWSDDLVGLANLPRDDEYERATAAMDAACHWAEALIRDRVGRPREDMISDLVGRVDIESLTEEQLRVELVTVVQMALAGHETTASLISSSVLHLAARPDLADHVANNPAGVALAVEELLRYDSPLQYLTRRATRDVELEGKTISAGQLVMPLLGAANRDERQFEAADELVLSRRPNPHVAFGHGPHTCLGGPLARIEARVSLPLLLQRLPLDRIRLEDAEWQQNAMFRGLRRLPVDTSEDPAAVPS